jgi:type 1 glutamine amidotransferase
MENQVDMRKARVLVANGTGAYGDPWHPFQKTGHHIAATLAREGFAVETSDDVDDAMTRLEGIDLLVVNAGDPWRTEASAEKLERRSSPRSEALNGFATGMERGMGLMAIHSATASMRDYPRWGEAIGAVWLPGISYHPPAGSTRVTGGSFPDGVEVEAFTVRDERYCQLQQIGARHIVATHQGAAGPEPTAWVRTVGESRVAVDLLGHDERSFESVGHLQLLTQLAVWASRAVPRPE